MATEKKIVKLLAKRGNKFNENGDTVGSYERSIVFLPKGAEPDKDVRVELIPLTDAGGKERTDSRGWVMYRSRPAPIEYVDRWRDNEDGTLSRVTFSIDWKFQEREEGVCETRPIAKRETDGGHKSIFKILWGDSLATSVVEESRLAVILLEEERVDKNALVWKRVGERSAPSTSEMFTIISLTVDPASEWGRNKLEVAYQGGVSVSVNAKFHSPTRAYDDNQNETTTWGSMPQWWRDEQEKLYPVCSCGRRRVGSSPDGYQKCQICRSEENCGSCGQSGQVKLVGSQLICPYCELTEAQVELVNSHVPVERRRAIGAEVARLLNAKAVEGEIGESVLVAMGNFLEKFKGFPWYYFDSSGVFGSRFSPIALQILQNYPKASGHGLVRLTAWLAGDAHTKESCDRSQQFFWVTQVKGEEKAPNLSQYDLEKLSVAMFLRGAEAERQTLATRVAALIARANWSEQRELEALLTHLAHDYRARLADCDRIEEKIRQRELVEQTQAEEREREERERLEAEAEARQFQDAAVAKERQKYACILDLGFELHDARQIEQYVSEALESIGGRWDQLLAILTTQAEAEYGRDRRVSALQAYFPKVDHSRLDWKHSGYGGHIGAVVAWAEHVTRQPGKGRLIKMTVEKTVEPTPHFRWQPEDKRNFRHVGCGRHGTTIRLEKSEYGEYQAGQDLVRQCPGCKSHGVVTLKEECEMFPARAKESTRLEQPISSGALATEDEVSAGLAALQTKFGKKGR